MRHPYAQLDTKRQEKEKRKRKQLQGSQGSEQILVEPDPPGVFVVAQEFLVSNHLKDESVQEAKSTTFLAGSPQGEGHDKRYRRTRARQMANELGAFVDVLAQDGVVDEDPTTQVA